MSDIDSVLHLLPNMNKFSSEFSSSECMDLLQTQTQRLLLGYASKSNRMHSSDVHELEKVLSMFYSHCMRGSRHTPVKKTLRSILPTLAGSIRAQVSKLGITKFENHTLQETAFYDVWSVDFCRQASVRLFDDDLAMLTYFFPAPHDLHEKFLEQEWMENIADEEIKAEMDMVFFSHSSEFDDASNEGSPAILRLTSYLNSSLDFRRLNSYEDMACITAYAEKLLILSARVMKRPHLLQLVDHLRNAAEFSPELSHLQNFYEKKAFSLLKILQRVVDHFEIAPIDGLTSTELESFNSASKIIHDTVMLTLRIIHLRKVILDFLRDKNYDEALIHNLEVYFSSLTKEDGTSCMR